MSIHRLVLSHAAEYRALMLEAYDLDPDAFTATVAERGRLPLSWWESRLAEGPRPDVLFFGSFLGAAGAISAERLVGAVGLAFETREKIRHKATLIGMYVHPGARRAGLGRGLVEAALAEARARPEVLLVQLTVTGGNAAAQALYERCGFVPFGVEPLAVVASCGLAPKVHMWRDLKK